VSPGTDAWGGALGASRGVEAGNRAVETFAGWELRDPLGRRVGRVSRVFLDPSDRAARVEVAMGPLGTRTVLLPVDGVRVDREECALFLGRARGRGVKGIRTGATRSSENPLCAQFREPLSKELFVEGSEAA
jgi:hypothetical protein